MYLNNRSLTSFRSSVSSRSSVRVALAGLLGLLACEPKTDDDTDGSATASASATVTTTAGTESTTATETDGTSGSTTDPTTATTTTATTTTSSSSTTDATTDATTGMNCNPQDLPECAVDSCTQRWSYDCGECGIDFDRALCFGIDVGCTYPKLSCDLPKPCDRVWAYGPGILDTFESEDAAICVLTSLRDGDLAHHEIIWGEMSDVGAVRMDVYADGAGGATVQWEVDCQGCPVSGTFGRSGVLKLQDQAFFDGCLNAPTTETLLDCMYGFTEFDEGSGLEEGETLPWVTGECTALEFGCPG